METVEFKDGERLQSMEAGVGLASKDWWSGRPGTDLLRAISGLTHGRPAAINCIPVKYRLKHVVEYGFLRGLSGLLNILPYRAALFVGWLLARIFFHIVRFRVAPAKARIREVFGDKYTNRQVNHIAWISLRNTFFNAVEVVRMGKVTKEWVVKVIDYQEIHKVRDTLKPGQGGILVVPHTGNWDLAGVAAQKFDLPMFFVVGKQKNPLTDEYLNRMRGITGIETIPRDSSVLRKVIKNLRAGKVLAFMTDLRSKTPGVKVRFLGAEANVVGGMALFARQAGVPVFPAVITRVGWGRHRWRIHDPIYPNPDIDKETDWQRMTQHVMDIYDKAIREEPEQYFWYNKRWVLDPIEPVAAAAGLDEAGGPGSATPATEVG